jgi:cytosine/adenosine deaminase-related metal-dependent hydrolase
MTPVDCDLLVVGGQVLTMDPERRILDDGGVAVTSGRIEAVGTGADIRDRYRPRKIIDATGGLVMPGLINTHTHVIQSLLRGGLAQDRSLFDWLLNYHYAGLGAFRPDDARLGATLYCAEAIRGGITTIVDNADERRDDDVAVASIQAFVDIGIRAIYGRMFSDRSVVEPPELGKYAEAVMRRSPNVKHATDFVESTEDALAHVDSLVQRFHGAGGGRIQVWPAPTIPNLTSEAGLMGSLEMAERNGTMVTVHLSEAPIDATMYGMSSTEYLYAIGFLSPLVLAAHCVHCNERDLRLLRSHDVKVAHNAISNLYLASGFAPVARMAALGITVGLGTDDPDCNETINMFLVMKAAALVQKAHNLDAAALTSEQVVEMATIDGARAVGMEDRIGSLEVGKRADIIVVDLQEPQLQPMHHVPNALVYQAYGSEVRTTIIDGEVLMEDRALIFLEDRDEASLYREARAASLAIIERANLEGLDRGWASLRKIAAPRSSPD